MESQLIRVMSKTTGKQLSSGVLEPFGEGEDLPAPAPPRTLLYRFDEDGAPDPGSGAEPSRSCLAGQISSYLFSYLHGYHIPTHFIAGRDHHDMLVRSMTMFPVSLRIWNTVGPTFARHFGLREGSELSFPILEHYYTGARSQRPLVNEFHLFSLGAVTPGELRSINRLGSKSNAVLRSLFARRGLKLHSLFLAFGIADGQIMLGDELTPRTCLASEDHPRPRRGKEVIPEGGKPTLEAYRIMRDRLLVMPEGSVAP